MRIVLTNHNAHKVYRHSLVRITGTIQCYNAQLPRPTDIKVISTNDCSNGSTSMVWPIVNDNFVVCLHCSQEVNRFKLWIEQDEEEQLPAKVIDSIDLCLRFCLPKKHLNQDPIVRLVYVQCKDSQNMDQTFEDGRFEAPSDEDPSVHSACERISLAALLTQCFIGETIGRTFQLEHCTTSGDAMPLVHRLVLPQCEHELWSLSSEQIWKVTATELMASGSAVGASHCKYLAFGGFSRYEAESIKQSQGNWWLPSERVKGYVSLGGGGLALLSTHGLYTWPQSLAQMPHRLSDTRPIDRDCFMDDSDHRNTRAGCWATTFGATVHELAHTFSLAHSEFGIMDRHFNQIDQFFGPHNKLCPVWWTESEVAILRHHKWLNHCVDGEQQFTAQTQSGHEGFFSMDKSTQSIDSENGLVVVEYRQIETNRVLKRQVWSDEHSPKCYKLQTNEFCDKECIFFAMDCEGNILRETIICDIIH